LWHLFTSVDFAVFQIIFLALLAVIGMTIKQLPDFAFRSATDYALAMDQTHARYDPVMGAALVDVMERLSLFAVFRSAWFSLGLVVLHPRPDAASVARRQRHPGQPARAVFRPSPARPCCDGRRGAGRRPWRPAQGWLPRPRG
jgi:hypothetical protein